MFSEPLFSAIKPIYYKMLSKVYIKKAIFIYHFTLYIYEDI